MLTNRKFTTKAYPTDDNAKDKPMIFMLRIEMDNAAFDDNDAIDEVAALLREAAQIIEGDGLAAPGVATHLRDSNGNKVGGFAVKAEG